MKMKTEVKLFIFYTFQYRFLTLALAVMEEWREVTTLTLVQNARYSQLLTLTICAIEELCSHWLNSWDLCSYWLNLRNIRSYWLNFWDLSSPKIEVVGIFPPILKNIKLEIKGKIKERIRKVTFIVCTVFNIN